MKISFIIVEYKDTEVLRKAIDSIIQHSTSLPYEIIIVSNSCYNVETRNSMSDRYPSAVFIYNKENYGFGKAVNQGIQASTGKFVLLLNPDAILLDNSILDALKFMEKRRDVACIGPMIIDCMAKVQDSCRDFMTPAIWVKRMMKRLFRFQGGGVLESKDYRVIQQVDWVSGACMLVRAEAVQQVGLMDPRYFMYIEDMDWCRTFKKHGWQTWYYPFWKVEHNASRGSSSQFNFFNRLTWFHVMSLCKYYLKWSFRF